MKNFLTANSVYNRLAEYSKKAFENKLPNEILYRKKVGFPVPLHNWFDGKFKKYAKTILLGSAAKSRKIYN